MNYDTSRPIVLIHGLSLTPRSWENWVAHYSAYGYKVIAPPYPGLEVEVEALRADPTPIANLSIDEVAEYDEEIAKGSRSRQSSWPTPSAPPLRSYYWTGASGQRRSL